ATPSGTSTPSAGRGAPPHGSLLPSSRSRPASQPAQSPSWPCLRDRRAPTGGRHRPDQVTSSRADDPASPPPEYGHAVSNVFLFALSAALNPTLLTATTVMLLLPNPKRLMLGYLAGAYTNGIIVGVAIVEWLSGSGVVSST